MLFISFRLFICSSSRWVSLFTCFVLLGVAGRVLLAAAWVLLADYVASSVFVDELACVAGSSTAHKLGSCFYWLYIYIYKGACFLFLIVFVYIFDLLVSALFLF